MSETLRLIPDDALSDMPVMPAGTVSDDGFSGSQELDEVADDLGGGDDFDVKFQNVDDDDFDGNNYANEGKDDRPVKVVDETEENKTPEETVIAKNDSNEEVAQLKLKVAALEQFDELIKGNEALRNAVAKLIGTGELDLTGINLSDVAEPTKPDDFDPFEAHSDPESTSGKYIAAKEDFVKSVARKEALAVLRAEQKTAADKANEAASKAAQDARGMLATELNNKFPGNKQLHDQFFAWVNGGMFKDANEMIEAFVKINGIKTPATKIPGDRSTEERRVADTATNDTYEGIRMRNKLPY